MGIYNLQDPYGLSTWYGSNGAYDLNAGTDLLMDLPRHILESDAYIFQGIAFPKDKDIILDAGQTFSGSLNLTPYSYLVSLTGWSGNGNQFTLRIYDKNAQTDLYFPQFAWFPTVLSNMTGGFEMGKPHFQNDKNKPFGPFFFRDPLIVLPPGVLQVQVTNVAPAGLPPPAPVYPGLVQVLFGMAVPKSTVSLNNRKVTSGTDQSGLPTLLGMASNI